MTVASAGGIVWGIIGFALLAALVYGVFRLVRGGGRAGKRMFSTARARSQLSPEEKEHTTAMRNAHKKVERAEKEHRRAVHDAEKAVAKQQKPKTIGRYRQTTLTDGTISGPGGGGQLTSEVQASVDTAGNLAVTKRVTLTRLAAGGIVGGLVFQKKQKHDSRELYLMVEGPDFAILQECSADDGAKVRKFAQQINVAAKASVARAEERAQTLAEAEGRLSRVREDRSAIVAAKAEAAALEASDPPAALPPASGDASDSVAQ